MEQQTQKTSTNNPDAPLPPPCHGSLPAMLKLLQEQAHERRLSAVPLAARLLRECGGGSLKARRERAQVTAHEALRLAKSSGGNYCSHRRESSSISRPSAETAHPQDPPPPEHEGINHGVQTDNSLTLDHKGMWSTPDLEGNGCLLYTSPSPRD